MEVSVTKICFLGRVLVQQTFGKMRLVSLGQVRQLEA
jgi:hypothetical protein